MTWRERIPAAIARGKMATELNDEGGFVADDLNSIHLRDRVNATEVALAEEVWLTSTPLMQSYPSLSIRNFTEKVESKDPTAS